MSGWSGLFLVPCIAMAFGSMAVGSGAVAADEMAGAADKAPAAPAGYLPQTALPNSVALLPPPPALGSVEEALDQDVARANLALRGSPRWTLAGMDADLSFPWAAGDFSCAVGAPITEQDTPRTLYNAQAGLE